MNHAIALGYVMKHASALNGVTPVIRPAPVHATAPIDFKGASAQLATATLRHARAGVLGESVILIFALIVEPAMQL